ncbi:MAG TPA: carboxylesterase/lipase family protein [Ktedonobacterales bacterium]
MTNPIVQTDAGVVIGSYEQDVATFRGIPFAAPPVGPRRFAAPQPPEPWDGVREARAYSATPPQLDPSTRRLPGLDLAPLFGDGWQRGDDYLTVNVWTPEVGAGSGSPVMVFIFGGAFVAGSSAVPLYSGARFARDGVVFVNFNYRVGVEGFLPLEGGETNLGLRDQIAALRWVQENIAGFGGDPRNVTIFGESSGALSVDTLLSVPAARGLFRRAISQSGGGQHTMSREQAGLVAARLAETLGVAPARADIATIPFERLIEAQTQTLVTSVNLNTARDADPTGGLTLFMPVRDGDLISTQPVEALRQGASGDVDILVGTNADEMNLYYAPSGVVGMLDNDEKVVASLAGRHPDPASLLATYRASRPGAQPGALFSAIMTDWMFGIPTLRLAEAHAPQPGGTYVYEFAWPTPTLGGALGTCHGLELGFVFDTLDTPGLTGPEGMAGERPPAELASQVHRAWINFARTGDPGWPSYNAQSRAVMRINTPWALVNDPRPEERQAWEGAR